MHLHEEEKNILTGILGTIAVHLIILIVFLVARIDKVKDIHRESLLIEFDEELFRTLQEMEEEQKTESKAEPLSEQEVKNIAVNTANRLEQEISTEKYIEQLKEELDIEEINQQLDNDPGDLSIASPDDSETPEPKEIPEYQGPTRISYDLGGRSHRYLYRPIYKCRGGGRVKISIIVNPEGEVINATILSTDTNEPCINETALESARLSLFEIDLQEETRHAGTISYEFVPQ